MLSRLASRLSAWLLIRSGCIVCATESEEEAKGRSYGQKEHDKYKRKERSRE
jgi:hypothetical protein